MDQLIHKIMNFHNIQALAIEEIIAVICLKSGR